MVRAFELALALRRDPLLAIIDAHVAGGQTAIDIGAHRGWYTRRLAARVGPQGTVHAVEPNEDVWHTLEAIARHYPAVAIHRVAASDRSGTATLRRPYIDDRRTDAMGSISNPAIDGTKHDTQEVPVSRLDDLLAKQEHQVAFIKCDVEGHEHEVFVGSESLLAKHRPVVLVEIEQRHRARPVSDTFDWFAAREFEGYVIKPEGRRPLSEFDVDRDQLRYLGPSLHSGRPDPRYMSDFLFVPRR